MWEYIKYGILCGGIFHVYTWKLLHTHKHSNCRRGCVGARHAREAKTVRSPCSLEKARARECVFCSTRPLRKTLLSRLLRILAGITSKTIICRELLMYILSLSLSLSLSLARSLARSLSLNHSLSHTHTQVSRRACAHALEY